MALGLTPTAKRMAETVSRPANAWLGRISRVDRHSIRVLDRFGSEHVASIPTNGDVLVGDWAWLPPDEERDAYALIAPRYHVLTRVKASGEIQPLTSNIDLVLLTVTAREALRPGLIERLAVTGWESGATPRFVISKVDELAQRERDLALQVIAESAPGIDTTVTSALTGEGLETLSDLLTEPVSAVLLGHSGVGKSSLVNRLCSTNGQASQAVRERDGKGRHTTTARTITPLRNGDSVVIDTPGIRQFGVSINAPLSDVFTDIEALAESCRFTDCSHTEDAGCAVRHAVENGRIPADRYRRYLALLREQEFMRRRDSSQRRDKSSEYSRLARQYRRARGH